MSGFSTDWLDLREPADLAARDMALVARLSRLMRPGARITDLGSGTGASVRALAPHLPDACAWTLVDHDDRLLKVAESRLSDQNIATRKVDLVTDLIACLSPAPDLLTSSALIDLCSDAWLAELARNVSRQTILYMALAYDGQEAWNPSHPEEARALSEFNAHQRRDKGFGPALGPDAASHLAGHLHAQGWDVQLADSPWVLGDNDRDLIEALAGGAAQAVAEMIAATGSVLPDWHPDWHQARSAARSVHVGHIDLLAVHPDR